GRLVVYVVGVGTLFEVASKSWYSIFQAYQRLELASATLILQRIVTAVAGILALVLLRLDVTMLSFLGDAAKVGIYAVSFRLVEATQFLGSALSAAMLPWLARGGRPRGIGVARGYALGLKAINGLLLPVGLVLVLFARPVIELLYGDGFGAAVLPLQLLGMMALTFGLNAFAAMTLIARNR